MRNSHLQVVLERVLHVMYRGDPKDLPPYRIPGTEPIELEGGIAVGLTASLFREVTFKGIRISGEEAIPKLDLQTYVRWKSADGKERSGALLIDEFFPLKKNVLLSKWLMGNDPRVLRMDQEYRFGQDGLISQFRWEHEGKWSTLKVAATKDMDALGSEGDPRTLSPSFYFFEGKGTFRKCRVEHPEWSLHPVFDTELRIDPSLFALPREAWDPNRPHSVHSIEGSSVSLSKAEKLPSR